jgi:hypothetical protein
MRTVFVIGAGANKEIWMPDGNELKTKIAEFLDFYFELGEVKKGDKIIYTAIRQLGDHIYLTNNVSKFNMLYDASKIISKAMPLSISIDNYIEAQKGDEYIEKCGKLAIVRAILEAEQNCVLSKVYKNKTLGKTVRTENIMFLNNSWYPSLYKKITEGCNIDELITRLNDISFIIFNYDRCFEYYMYNALMIYYNIKQDDAKNIIQNYFHINHPYGVVGDLFDKNNEITFGNTPNYQLLLSLSEKIMTFTERKIMDDEKESNERIKYLIERTDRIIFLGFAYHDQNLNLLFNQPGVLYVLDGVPMSDKVACYGTAHGISEKDLERVCKTLQTADSRIKDIDISDATCSQFFKDFWYRLSFK